MVREKVIAILMAIIHFSSVSLSAEDLLVPPESIGTDVVKREYDKFKEETQWTVTGKYQKADKPAGTQIAMVAYFEKVKNTTLGSAFIVFASNNESWVNLGKFSQFRKEDNKIVIFVNGKREERTFEFSSKPGSEIGSGMNEYYGIRISLKDLSTWANARSVEAQAGNLRFTLSLHKKQLLLALLSQVPRGEAGDYTIKTDEKIQQRMDAKVKADQLAREKQLEDMKASREAKIEEEKLMKEIAELKKLESRASTSLGLIKRHLYRKNPRLAQKKLKELVKKYPGTEAAEEAAKLIKK